jgi:glycogen operon protein
LSHSQKGNNNAYSHDDATTWLDWNLDERRKDFLQFVRRCADIWREQPVLQRRKFFLGRAIRGSGIKDISWFGPDGKEMSDEAWNDGNVKVLGMRLAGDEINEVDEHGEAVVGDTLLLLMNAYWETIQFKLPDTKSEHVWESLLDTADPHMPLRVCRGGEQYPLQGRTFVVLRTTKPEHVGREISPAQAEGLRRDARRANQPVPNSPSLVS